MSSRTYRSLYPEIEPYDQGMLQVSEIHTLYYEQSGNPDGKPVVFLHGGPGAGCAPTHRRFLIRQHIASYYLTSVAVGVLPPLLNCVRTPLGIW